MRALRLMSWKSEPELVEVDEPKPGPGDAVIKIGGSGACHSDLHLMHEFDAGTVPWNPPFTLGHENAGWVHELGAGVEGFEVGQAVAVYGPWGCGRCARCLQGMETYCQNPAEAPVPGGGGGLGLDGGMADFMLVRAAERHLLHLPSELEPQDAAPLTDAGLTPYHAIVRSLGKLSPSATAVVIGVGGLGHLGVRVLRAMSAATIVAVDLRKEALDLASEMGADHGVLVSDTAADEIKALTGGVGAELVVDFVGADPTLALAAQVVGQLGDLTIVGIGGGTLPVGFFSVPYEASIQTTYWGSQPELREVLEMGARGMLLPKTTIYSLDDAAQAYRDLQAGTIDGRAVIVP